MTNTKKSNRNAKTSQNVKQPQKSLVTISETGTALVTVGPQ
jgi:hypothetical protein